MAQEEAAKRVAAIDGTLTERKIAVDSHEEDLAAREEALAMALRAKDDEIKTLLSKHSEELEQKHREALQAQVLDHAEKLKEALDAINAADVAKADLNSKIKKLEEDLATKNQETTALQDSV